MTRKRKNIVMLANATHKPLDTRFFHKEAKSLLRNGYSVTIIIPHSESFSKDGVDIIAVPLPVKGWEQLVKCPWKIFLKAVKHPSGESIFHLQDSELLVIGLLLKILGRKVIYDAHEDTPLQISYQHWIPRGLKKPYAWFYYCVEKIVGWTFDAIIVAEPIIARYFPKHKTFLVRNFPMKEMFEHVGQTEYRSRSISLLYVGLLSRVRGVIEMLEGVAYAQKKLKVRFVLGGKFAPQHLADEVKEKYKGTAEILSWVDYGKLLEMLSDTRIGISIPHPIERYKGNYPVKLFEYMACGLPVISSKEGESALFVKEASCGILVDPLNSHEVGEAIVWLLNNAEEAMAMGERGRKMIFEKYNWENEATVLLSAIEFVG
jgi:glycosyltransferase involved in cell wall biosynthesis